MTPLDSRAWLVWGLACMVPLLMSRHPVIVVQLLLVVITVRVACLPPAAMRWRWIGRLALLFAAGGVVFNALTVRTGNQVAFVLPGAGWEITWNAIAYGLVSGLAMITLVLTGITLAAGLDWIALTRVLPQRFAPLAVSGSVAWSFLPGASQAISEIREAQVAAAASRARAVADALYGYGRYAEAAELYRAALTKSGADRDLLNLRLGSALAMAGQRAEAEAAFRAAEGQAGEIAKLWLAWLSRRQG